MPTPPSALALRRATAPASCRANPPASSPPWTLERRHAEGGPWFPVDRLWTRQAADDWVIGPTVDFDPGDLLRLRSPSGATVGFWVRTRSGLVSAGRVSSSLRVHGWDWELAWEGPGAQADEMLRVAARADRVRLVRAAVDCAEPAVRLAPQGEARPRQALELARRWARGEASAAEVRRALPDIAGYARACQQAVFDRPAPVLDLGQNEAAVLLNLVVATASSALHAVFRAYTADYAAQNAASALGYDRRQREAPSEVSRADARDEALRAMAPLVRRWIPLPVVLLARAGEPTPLSLVF